MLGPAGPLSEMPNELKGVMPRSLDAIFKSLRTNRALTSWKMSISYVEVYCEVIRDLLSVEKTARETAGKGKAAQSGLDVIESKDGVMHLKNLVPTQVSSMAVRPRPAPTARPPYSSSLQFACAHTARAQALWCTCSHAGTRCSDRHIYAFRSWPKALANTAASFDTMGIAHLCRRHATVNDSGGGGAKRV